MSQTYWWHLPTSSNTTDITWKMREQSNERVVVHREVSFSVEREGDGRTLLTRIVPYNTPATVADPPDFVPYTESWLPGVFDKQLNAANRVDVLLNFEHEQGIGGVVGRGVKLESLRDGLHGEFRVLANTDGDKTLELVREKILTGMSLEAVVYKSLREDGIVQRKEARLRNVAICRNPGFADAKVLAVREGDPEPEPEPVPDEPAPDEPAPDEEAAIVVPELAVRDDFAQLLERVGVESLVRRAIVRTPWDGSPSRFDDEQYKRSCLIDRGGDMPMKERCSLPVLEPNGDLNVNAMHAAAARLNQVTGVSSAQKAAAARKLIRYYRQAGEDPPSNIVNIAGR